jgi:small subunit ribosomal protein S16
MVAVDNRKKRDGRAVEILGHYNPNTKPATIEFKEDSVYEWLKKGAVPSDTFRSLLRQMGVWYKWGQMKQGKDVSAVEAKRKPEKEKAAKPSKKSAAKAAKAAQETKEEKKPEAKEEKKPEANEEKKPEA